MSEELTGVKNDHLYYFPKIDWVYKVIGIEKDSDGNPKSVKLLKHNSSDILELNCSEDIDSLRKYVKCIFKFAYDGAADEIFNADILLQQPFEKQVDAYTTAVIKKPCSMFKFCHNGKIFDKANALSSLEQITDNMLFYGIIGFSTEYKFTRFRKDYVSPYWSSNATTPDAIMFIPNETVFLCGFSLYAPREPNDSYEVQYTIYVDNVAVEDKGKKIRLINLIVSYRNLYLHRVGG